MNKTSLIEKVAAEANVTKKDAAIVVNATFDAITESLAAGESVQLIGFGTFETRARKARTGHNPQTGETIKIKASKTPAFKPGKALKDAVNTKKKGKK